MNLETIVQTYFCKESLVDIFTTYELYYQMGVGAIAYETIQEEKEIIEKIQELNLQIKLNQVISYVVEIFLNFRHEKNFSNQFKYHLRSRALTHALSDFIQKDKDLINPNYYRELVSEKIYNDTFLNDYRIKQFDT